MKHTAFILSLICATAWADNSQPWQEANRLHLPNRLCPMKSVSK